MIYIIYIIFHHIPSISIYSLVPHIFLRRSCHAFPSTRWAVVGREVSVYPGLAMFKTFCHPLRSTYCPINQLDPASFLCLHPLFRASQHLSIIHPHICLMLKRNLVVHRRSPVGTATAFFGLTRRHWFTKSSIEVSNLVDEDPFVMGIGGKAMASHGFLGKSGQQLQRKMEWDERTLWSSGVWLDCWRVKFVHTRMFLVPWGGSHHYFSGKESRFTSKQISVPWWKDGLQWDSWFMVIQPSSDPAVYGC